MPIVYHSVTKAQTKASPRQATEDLTASMASPDGARREMRSISGEIHISDFIVCLGTNNAPIVSGDECND